MAYTASYIIGKDRYIDNNCFASLRNISDENIFIIIEKHKFYFKRDKIEEYLNDIIEIGFDISFSFNEEQNEYLINITKLSTTFNRILCCILLRFLWEGYYKPDSFKIDRFYLVVEHYFNLKLKFPEENKLKLICLACNCFIYSGNPFNCNHFLSNKAGCKIINSLPLDYIGSILFYFSNVKDIDYTVATKNLVYGKKPEEWNDQDYNKIFKYIKYE